MSRTRCASSERPATSASSGSVQSISTTWTPTRSAFAGRASSAARATMDRSVRPPDSATTARRNWGADVSATSVGTSAYRRPRTSDWVTPRTGRRAGPRYHRACARPRRTADIRRPLIAGLRLAQLRAPVRDVGDDGVLAPDELPLEALGRLVVEQ